MESQDIHSLIRSLTIIIGCVIIWAMFGYDWIKKKKRDREDKKFKDGLYEEFYRIRNEAKKKE